MPNRVSRFYALAQQITDCVQYLCDANGTAHHPRPLDFAVQVLALRREFDMLMTLSQELGTRPPGRGSSYDMAACRMENPLMQLEREVLEA